MTTLRKCWLMLLLLAAGCDGSAPKGSGPAERPWQVTWNAVDGATGYAVAVNGQQYITTEPVAVVLAQRGQLLKCWATDGSSSSAASAIVLGN